MPIRSYTRTVAATATIYQPNNVVSISTGIFPGCRSLSTGIWRGLGGAGFGAGLFAFSCTFPLFELRSYRILAAVANAAIVIDTLSGDSKKRQSPGCQIDRGNNSPRRQHSRMMATTTTTTIKYCCASRIFLPSSFRLFRNGFAVAVASAILRVSTRSHCCCCMLRLILLCMLLQGVRFDPVLVSGNIDRGLNSNGGNIADFSIAMKEFVLILEYSLYTKGRNKKRFIYPHVM